MVTFRSDGKLKFLRGIIFTEDHLILNPIIHVLIIQYTHTLIPFWMGQDW